MIPNGVHDTVYMVVDCYGKSGCVWREADINRTDMETVIGDLMDGQYSDPLCIVAFNASERWSRDVTADIAREIKHRCDRAGNDVPPWLEDLIHQHVGADDQLALRLTP